MQFTFKKMNGSWLTVEADDELRAWQALYSLVGEAEYNLYRFVEPEPEPEPEPGSGSGSGPMPTQTQTQTQTQTPEPTKPLKLEEVCAKLADILMGLTTEPSDIDTIDDASRACDWISARILRGEVLEGLDARALLRAVVADSYKLP